MAKLKQMTQSYSSCVTDCQNWFGERKTSWRHFEINIKASFFCIWLRCCQWFLVLNPSDEWLPSGFFLKISRSRKAKFNQDRQLDRPSHVCWPVPCEQVKVKFMKTTAKLKVSFTEKKVLNFKESFIFQSKCCIIKPLLH